MKIETKFNVNDKVSILPFNRLEGIIKGIWIDKNENLLYYTRFINNSRVVEEYLYEDEIEPIHP